MLEDRDEHPEYVQSCMSYNCYYACYNIKYNTVYMQTPLTRACQFGHKDIVEHLLVEGDEPHPMALVKAIEGLYT